MSHHRIRWTALGVALALASTAFVAGASDASTASPSWPSVAGSIAGPGPAPTAAHGTATSHASPAGCYQGRCEYLASMYVVDAVSTGTTAMLNQPRPKVVNGERSITAIQVASADGRQSVLFGWMISKTAFHDTLPHLVISSVVNGVPGCINGCGFVPMVKSAPKVAVGHIGKYTIKLSKARWLIVYNNKTLGYYPVSKWRGNKLSRSHLAAAFGDVTSPSKTTPRSDMGNGKLGTSAKSAKVVGMSVLNATGTPSYEYVAIDAPAKYTIGFINGACTRACSMNYGGPGF